MQKEITLSKLDKVIFERLQYEADRQGTDLSAIIMQMVKRSLGLEKISDENIIYNDLDYLSGTWANDDFTQFDANISEFNKIDEGLWK